MEKLAYTVPEFLTSAGIGRTTFYEEVKSGRLKVVKVGARTLVPANEARAWLDRLAEAHEATP